MPPKFNAVVATDVTSAVVAIRDKGDIMVGEALDAEGTTRGLSKAALLPLLGTFSTTAMVSILTTFKAVMFNWKRGPGAGELLDVAVSKAAAAGGIKSAVQTYMELLGFHYADGADFVHPQRIVPHQDVARALRSRAGHALTRGVRHQVHGAARVFARRAGVSPVLQAALLLAGRFRS